MNPKKSKDILKKVAKDLNQNEELVEDIIDHFYKKVRNKMVNLEDTVILIHNFGSFTTKRTKLIKYKEKMEKRIKDTPVTDTFGKFTFKKDAIETLEKVNNLLGILDEEDKRKQLVKEKRNATTNKNMEE